MSSSERYPLESRVIYICFAPEDLPIAKELEARFASQDPETTDFPLPVYCRFSGDDRRLNHFRIEASACLVLIYTEHTSGNGRVVQDVSEALRLKKPVFPLFLSDAPMSSPLCDLIDAENYQTLATCLLRREIIAKLADRLNWFIFMGKIL